VILVDDVRRYRSGWWYHMVSDRSVEELHAFASEIGLRREWFQGGARPHYDLRPSTRRDSVSRGPRRWARGSSSGGWRVTETLAPWDRGLAYRARDATHGRIEPSRFRVWAVLENSFERRV
jgi:hypothetical protein